MSATCMHSAPTAHGVKGALAFRTLASLVCPGSRGGRSFLLVRGRDETDLDGQNGDGLLMERRRRQGQVRIGP